MYAWRVSCSSIRRRSLTSRIVRMTPRMSGSASSEVTWTSEARHRPSAAQTSSSTACAPSGFLAAAAITWSRTWASPGFSRVANRRPMRASGSWPRIRAIDGVWYRITPWASTTVTMSEEFCTSDRNHFSRVPRSKVRSLTRSSSCRAICMLSSRAITAPASRTRIMQMPRAVATGVSGIPPNSTPTHSTPASTRGATGASTAARSRPRCSRSVSRSPTGRSAPAISARSPPTMRRSANGSTTGELVAMPSPSRPDPAACRPNPAATPLSVRNGVTVTCRALASASTAAHATTTSAIGITRTAKACPMPSSAASEGRMSCHAIRANASPAAPPSMASRPRRPSRPDGQRIGDPLGGIGQPEERDHRERRGEDMEQRHRHPPGAAGRAPRPRRTPRRARRPSRASPRRRARRPTRAWPSAGRRARRRRPRRRSRTPPGGPCLVLRDARSPGGADRVRPGARFTRSA